MERKKNFDLRKFAQCPEVLRVENNSQRTSELKDSYFKIKRDLYSNLEEDEYKLIFERMKKYGINMVIVDGLNPSTEEYCLKMTAVILAEKEAMMKRYGMNTQDAINKTYQTLIETGTFYSNDQMYLINSHLEKILGGLEDNHGK